MSTIRKMLITVAALGAIAAGSAAIAGAASKDTAADQGSSQSTQRPQGPQRPNETALSGYTADKVRKAALAKVAGATVPRLETDADQGAAYEAHLRKSDGTEVTVLVDKTFKVVAVRTCNGPRDGGPRGDGQPGERQPNGYQQQGGYFQPAPS